ncbi:hypothetical protein [Paraburkholderia sediminicola]|uniref:hypothetical protein n=1 Tax=Paraburkholderia sediminicola TaxID=458836 RepID=UPI0038BC2F3E
MDSLSVQARHDYLLPVALQAIGVAGEVVDKQVWYKDLEPYQLGPMHTLLKQHGYAPATTDTTLAKMRKLILAGLPDTQKDARILSFGEGVHKVVIAANRVVTYRGESRTVQVLGSRYRVKTGGKLVSLWTWLEPSVSKHDQAAIRELIAQADYAAGARLYAERQRESEVAQVDALDIFDTADTGIARDSAC